MIQYNTYFQHENGKEAMLNFILQYKMFQIHETIVWKVFQFETFSSIQVMKNTKPKIVI